MPFSIRFSDSLSGIAHDPLRFGRLDAHRALRFRLDGGQDRDLDRHSLAIRQLDKKGGLRLTDPLEKKTRFPDQIIGDIQLNVSIHRFQVLYRVTAPTEE